MFFNTGEIISFILSPLTWICLLLVAATFNKNPRRCLIAAVFITIFFSNTFIFDRFMNAWEIKAIPTADILKKDAVIVLTGMTTYDPENQRLEFNDRTDRLMQAIKLYKENKVSKIILCGGPASTAEDRRSYTQLKDYLVTMGIPENDVILEDKSHNTRENAKQIKALMEAGFTGHTFYLVSSAVHLRRATKNFRMHGIDVVPFSTDRHGGPVKFTLNYLFLPSARTLFLWEKLMHEWIGSIKN